MRFISFLAAITSSESYIFLAVFAVLALVALIYLLSPMSVLDDVTARGAAFRERMDELLRRHDYPNAGTKTFKTFMELFRTEKRMELCAGR